MSFAGFSQIDGSLENPLPRTWCNGCTC